MKSQKALGLRIDVDTFTGARLGLPKLIDLLARFDVRASVFIPGGPDRTGMAVARVLTQRGYLAKLLRTRAFRIYGPSALAASVIHRNRRIAEAAGPLRRTVANSHELVAHGFVHTLWHNRLHRMSPQEIQDQVHDSIVKIEQDAGVRPVAFGGPGWQANFASLLAVDKCQLQYASDTRGLYPFIPRLAGYVFKTPQVPTTLPSLDEFPAGLPPQRKDVEALFQRLRSQAWPVYAAHAELEGRFHLDFFEEFLGHCRDQGLRIVPLSTLLTDYAGANSLQVCDVRQLPIEGRPGKVATQVLPET